MAELAVRVDPGPATSGARQIKRSLDDIKQAADGVERSTSKVGRSATESLRQLAGQSAMSAAELDRLRQKFNPLYAAGQQYKQTLNEIRRAHEVGALSVREMTAAIDREKAAFAAEVGVINNATAALRVHAQTHTAAAIAANDNMRYARQRMLNMTYQINDIGTMLATGASPFMILASQGGQVAQILGDHPNGVAGGLKETGRAAAGLATRLAPIGIAVGGLAIGFRALQTEINETSEVTVTFGDVVLAALQMVSDGLLTLFGPAIDTVQGWFADLWEKVEDFARDEFNSIARNLGQLVEQFRWATTVTAAYWEASVETAKAYWGGLPQALGDIVFQVAQNVVDGIEAMLNRSIELINAFIEKANSIFGTRMGTFDPFDLGVENPWAGMNEELNRRLDKIIEERGDAINQAARDYIDRVREIFETDYFADLGKRATENAVERLSKTEEAAEEAAKAIKKAQQEFDVFARAADGLVEKFFPDKAAELRAAELITLLDRFGDKLTEIQRGAVELEIDELLRGTGNAAEDAAKHIQDTLGTVLADLFSGPIEDADEFFDKLMSGLAQIGQHFMQLGIDRLLGGINAANDNSLPAQQMAQVNDRLEELSLSALNVARTMQGLNERADAGALDAFLQASGNWNNLSVQDTAWCAAFANAAIAKTGGAGTGSNLASSFLNWGMGTNAPQPGDIVVLKPQSSGASGHVGFLVGMGDGTVQVFGGNQGNGVNVSSFGIDQVAGFRTDPALRGVMTQAVEDGVIGAGQKIAAGTGVAPASAQAAGGNFLQNGGMGVLGAGIGAFAGGFQSGSPLMGGISGALTGLGAAGSIAGAFPALAGVAGPIGLIGGALIGILGGILGASKRRREERKKAQEEIEKQLGAITSLIYSAEGDFLGEYQNRFNEVTDELNKAIELAEKAGDSGLADRLRSAMDEFFDELTASWERGFEGMLEAMHAGVGFDGAFAEGIEAVESMKEALLGFVNDTRFFAGANGDLQAALDNRNAALGRDAVDAPMIPLGLDGARSDVSADYKAAVERWWSAIAEAGLEVFKTVENPAFPSSPAMETIKPVFDSVAGLRSKLEELGFQFDAAGDIIDDFVDEEAILEAVKRAQEAAQANALAILSGAEEFSAMEQEMQRLEGIAAALPPVLEELGMSAEEAAAAIEEHLNIAIEKLREDFVDDITRSINELSDHGFLNELLDAQLRYQDRLKDAAALGLDGSLALSELNLAIRDIAVNSSLTEAELRALAAAFPDLSGALLGSIGASSLADAEAAVDRAKADLRAAYNEEANEIERVISSLETAIDRLKDFRDGLRIGNLSPLSPIDRLTEAQEQFNEVSAKALAGDEDALADLQSVSQAYLDEARGYYASSEGYFQIFETVESILDQALAKAGDQLSEAEQQLAELKDQTSALIDINDSVMSVADAIDALREALGDLGAAGGGESFDPDQYWSPTIKSFYTSLQDYKATTGSMVAPESITGVWNAFANAASATEYDRLAAIYRIAVDNATQAWLDANGFAGGGYTGNFGVGQVAGVVHGQEFVMNAAATARWRPQFEAMNRGYAPSGNSSAEYRELCAEVRALKAEVVRLQSVTAAGARANVDATDRGTSATRDVERSMALSRTQRKSA